MKGLLILLVFFLVSCQVSPPHSQVVQTNTKSLQIATLAPTKTITFTSTITVTRTITPTVTITYTPQPTSEFSPIVGRIWTGVKVYYGVNKAYGFQILGGSDNCLSMPSGRGLYVLMPDGSKEWKDRNYIVFSGIYYVRKDDPASEKIVWYEYKCR